jgi:hypothetical protein
MSKRLADRLDWNRMLGFEQVTDDRGPLRVSSETRLGPKVGPKPGLKPGPMAARIGSKIGSKIGAKVGTKPGTDTIQ